MLSDKIDPMYEKASQVGRWCFDGAGHEGKVAVAFLGRVTTSATQYISHLHYVIVLRGGAEAATTEIQARWLDHHLPNSSVNSFSNDQPLKNKKEKLLLKKCASCDGYFTKRNMNKQRSWLIL